MTERPFGSLSNNPSSPLSRKRPEVEEEAQPKKFRIERKRLGEIRFVKEDGEYGFIRSEDFREDVFFHRFSWEAANGALPQADMFVEFEIDEEQFEQKQKLRAKVVRPTDRPMGRKMTARDAPYEVVFHHPKARRKRPTWRGNDEE